jgi:legumain
VKKNGIPESNIILMMEDDVAGARENPFPGKMFNKPTAKGEPGVDVYAGCVPDYKGADVTAKTFLAVLSGDTANVKGKGNGKVLKSTKADNVFVNFADHGGGEIVEMPNGPYLHASDLVNTLKQMNTNSMFRKLVFYMEACNGGSMFANLLPKDINVFATTAANPTEPSWGTYCPPDDMIDGKHVGSCLGDLYSVNWMEDSDAQGEKKTLEQQFQTVVKLTNKSHPTEYGDKTFTSDEVHTYQGHGSANTTVTTATGPAARKTPVDQRDIELLQMFYSYMRSDETAEGAKKQSLTAADASKRSGLALELMALVQKREADDKLFAGMLAGLATAAATAEGFEPPLKSSPTHAQCVKSVTNEVVDKCGGFTSYSLRYHADLVSYCAKMPAAGVAFVVDKACA